MWTDPEHFAAWYGPDGATIPVAKMDVRVGGVRLVSMEVQTPNGPMQMWFTGEYREVVDNQRLVYTEAMSDEHGTVLSPADIGMPDRSEEHTSELQSLMRTSYAVLYSKKTPQKNTSQ